MSSDESTASKETPPPAPKEEEKTSEKVSFPFSEGLILLIISAMAYLATYLYKRGEAYFFDIPTNLVSVSVDDLLDVGTWFLLGFLGMSYSVAAAINLSKTKIKETDVKTAVGFETFVLLMLLFFYWTGSTLGLKFIWIPFLIIFKFLYELIPPFYYKRKFKISYPASIFAWRFERKEMLSNLLFGIPIRNLLFFIFLSGFVLSFFFSSGYAKARDRKKFQFLGDDVILARSGNYFILAPIDKVTGQIQREFTLLSLDEVKKPIITKTKVSRQTLPPEIKDGTEELKRIIENQSQKKTTPTDKPDATEAPSKTKNGEN